MCGIAGYILNKQQYFPSLLKAMADVIVYRDPDDEEFYESFSNNKKMYIDLAHRTIN